MANVIGNHKCGNCFWGKVQPGSVPGQTPDMSQRLCKRNPPQKTTVLIPSPKPPGFQLVDSHGWPTVKATDEACGEYKDSRQNSLAAT